MSGEKKFKRLWITEPGKDYSDAFAHAEEVRYICNGYEFGDNRKDNIEAAVAEFDPATDAWIPVGRMVTVAQVGLQLGSEYPEDFITVGIWHREGTYTWEPM